MFLKRDILEKYVSEEIVGILQREVQVAIINEKFGCLLFTYPVRTRSENMNQPHSNSETQYYHGLAIPHR